MRPVSAVTLDPTSTSGEDSRLVCCLDVPHHPSRGRRIETRHRAGSGYSCTLWSSAADARTPHASTTPTSPTVRASGTLTTSMCRRCARVQRGLSSSQLLARAARACVACCQPRRARGCACARVAGPAAGLTHASQAALQQAAQATRSAPAAAVAALEMRRESPPPKL